MKLKLTRQQMEGMRDFIAKALDLPFEKNKANQLVRLLVKQIEEKLSKRIKQGLPEGKQKNFSLKDEQALALHCWYQHNRNVFPFQYPQIVLDGVFNDIDQHYA